MGRIIIGSEYFTGAQDLDGRLLALHNVYLTCRGLGSKQKFRRQVEGILHVSCGVILRGIQCGVFLPLIEHNHYVKKGDLIGKVVDPFEGTVKQQIRTAKGGLLFTLRAYPVVYEGDLLARILTE